MRSLFSHSSSQNVNSKQDSSVTRTDTISRKLNDTHDQKSLLEVDKLIKEIQQFLDGLNNAPKANQSVFDKLRNLNRKSSTVIANHKVLSDKLSESETRLNTISNNVLEHKKTLTNNASEFYYKLQTCIDYSHEVIPKRKSDLDFLSELFSDIIAWIHYLQAMIRFHQEIIHQEQSAMYVPRMFDQQSTGRAFTSTNTTKEREDDMIMIHKLTRLKKLHKKINKYLSKVSKSVEEQTSNLASLETAKLKLAQKLSARLKVDLKNLDTELNVIVVQDKRAELSKHVVCSDCSHTCLDSVDCVQQLEAYDKQDMLVANKLLDLVNLKQKMDTVLPTIPPVTE